MFLRFNSHDPPRLRYACYFLQSHAEVPKLALQELIEVLKPLNLKNRDIFGEGVSLQHRFITNYLFKASSGISIQYCVLHCIPQAHMASCISSISNAVQKDSMNSTVLPLKKPCAGRFWIWNKRSPGKKILQKKYNIILEPLTNLMNLFLA